MRYQAGKRSSLGQAIRHGLWAFLRTYFIRRGFLDGRAGFLIALMNAEASFYRYVKLTDLRVAPDVLLLHIQLIIKKLWWPSNNTAIYPRSY